MKKKKCDSRFLPGNAFRITDRISSFMAMETTKLGRSLSVSDAEGEVLDR